MDVYSRPSERGPDDVLFIAIPDNISLNIPRADIRLIDLEALSKCQLNNIFLSAAFPPFQYGISMSGVYKGFPLKDGLSIRDFLTKALAIKSHKLSDYQQLIEGPAA
jgi:hypothetical protein